MIDKLLSSEQTKLTTLALECSQVVDSPSLRQILDRLRDFIDLDYLVLGVLELSAERPTLQNIFNHSFPKTWVDLYIQESLSSIDPVLSFAAGSNLPFLWSSTSDKMDPVLDAARLHGLPEGIAFAASPCANSCYKTLLSFSGQINAVRSTLKYFTVLLTLATPLIHEAYSRIIWRQRQGLNNNVSLTGREREIVKWTMSGKSVEEIALILSLSNDTIKFHLKNIYQKLNVANRYQAVSVAIQAGLF